MAKKTTPKKSVKPDLPVINLKIRPDINARFRAVVEREGMTLTSFTEIAYVELCNRLDARRAKES